MLNLPNVPKPRPASELPPGPVSQADLAHRWWYCAVLLIKWRQSQTQVSEPTQTEQVA